MLQLIVSWNELSKQPKLKIKNSWWLIFSHFALLCEEFTNQNVLGLQASYESLAQCFSVYEARQQWFAFGGEVTDLTLLSCSEQICTCDRNFLKPCFRSSSPNSFSGTKWISQVFVPCLSCCSVIPKNH